MADTLHFRNHQPCRLHRLHGGRLGSATQRTCPQVAGRHPPITRSPAADMAGHRIHVAAESAGTAPSRTNRRHSSRQPWAAAVPCRSGTRRSTGRHRWAWSQVGRTRNTGRSARIRKRRHSSRDHLSTVDGKPALVVAWVNLSGWAWSAS